jgi:hypothetical protein
MISLRLRRCKPVSIRIVDNGFHGDRSDSERRIVHVTVAETMMMVATLSSLVVFILSVVALLGIYGWYPSFVAQQWFIYDQLFAVFSFLGMMFGAFATSFMLSKKSCWAVVTSGTACTVSGAGVFVVSLIQPLALLWQAMTYYFLPLFIAPLIGTLIIYVRKDEKNQV